MRQPRLTVNTSLATIAALAICLSGCGTLAPDGVYQGDKITYNAELAIVTAQDFLQTYVSWEHTNRAALASRPEVKKSADFIRANARKWITSAINLTEAYKANPTPETKDALQTGLRLLRTALAEASTHMLAATEKEN